MAENCKFPNCTFTAEKTGYCCRHKFMSEGSQVKESKTSDTKKPKQKPIKKVSKKLGADLRIYNVLAKDFLIDNPKCQCGREGCNRKSEAVHHAAGRGKNLTNVDTFIALSNECHRWAHDNHGEAKDLGLFISKFKPA